MKKVAIIGGGFSGLVLAFKLSEKYEVEVFEQSSKVGGLLETFTYQKVIIEKYYHHFFESDYALLDLMKQLGIANKIQWLDARMSIIYKQKFYSFSNVYDFLAFPFFEVTSKIRVISLGIFDQIFRLNLSPQKLFGEEIWKKLWEPLLKQKFGDFSENIHKSWLNSRIKKREKLRIFGYEKLGYPKNSFNILTERLVEKILEKGGKIFLNRRIVELNERDGSYCIGNKKYDFIVSTLPSCKNELLVGQKINNTHYLAAICAILITRDKLTNFYWNNVLDTKISFSGVIEQSNLAPYPFHISYLTKYIDPSSELYNLPNAELLDILKNDLCLIKPKTKIIDSFIFKYRYAQPIILEKPSMSHQIKNNFYQVNMEYIYPHDRGLNETIILIDNFIKKIK